MKKTDALETWRLFCSWGWLLQQHPVPASAGGMRETAIQSNLRTKITCPSRHVLLSVELQHSSFASKFGKPCVLGR